MHINRSTWVDRFHVNFMFYRWKPLVSHALVCKYKIAVCIKKCIMLAYLGESMCKCICKYDAYVHIYIYVNRLSILPLIIMLVSNGTAGRAGQ